MPDSAPVARAELVDVVEHPPTQTESVQPLPAETTDESRPAEAATATSHPSPESAVDGDTETPPKSAESPPNDDDDATASSIGFLLAETVTRRRKQPQPTKRPRGRPRKTPVSQARRKLSVLNKQTPTKRLAPVTTAFHPCKRCSARIAVTYANTPYIADGMILVNFCGECHAMALRLS
jgi:hypothetical protein